MYYNIKVNHLYVARSFNLYIEHINNFSVRVDTVSENPGDSPGS